VRSVRFFIAMSHVVAPPDQARILASGSRSDKPPYDRIRRNLRGLSVQTKFLQNQHFSTFVASFSNAC
jgi:hypothetical protein